MQQAAEDRQKRIVTAAADRGLAHVKTAEVARKAGCSEASVRSWMRGERVGQELARRIQGVLGLNEGE